MRDPTDGVRPGWSYRACRYCCRRDDTTRGRAPQRERSTDVSDIRSDGHVGRERASDTRAIVDRRGGGRRVRSVFGAAGDVREELTTLASDRSCLELSDLDRKRVCGYMLWLRGSDVCQGAYRVVPCDWIKCTATLEGWWDSSACRSGHRLPQLRQRKRLWLISNDVPRASSGT